MIFRNTPEHALATKETVSFGIVRQDYNLGQAPLGADGQLEYDIEFSGVRPLDGITASPDRRLANVIRWLAYCDTPDRIRLRVWTAGAATTVEAATWWLYVMHEESTSEPSGIGTTTKVHA